MDTRLLSTANGPGRSSTLFILHGMHARDLQRMPAEYVAKQGNAIQAIRNTWMQDYACGQSDMIYWHQHYMTDLRTGYTTPPGADGTHPPLHVELMKGQILLNFLCNSGSTNPDRG